jgi:hypothetical protein
MMTEVIDMQRKVQRPRIACGVALSLQARRENHRDRRTSA